MSNDSHELDPLVLRAREGEDGAREALFDQVEGRVLELVRRRMGERLRGRMESMDLAQSVLADAIRDLDKFEAQGDRAFVRWLTRVVENKLRKKARALNAPGRDPAPLEGLRGSEDAGETATVEPVALATSLPRAAGRNEDIQRLEQAMQSLTERERLLIQLRDREQLSWAEVVQRAGEPSLKSAQSCHARAMVKLSSWFADEA